MACEINSFLRNISPEVRTMTWYIFIVLLVVVACIMVGVYRFKKNKAWKQAMVSAILTLAAFAAVIAVAMLVENLTNEVILLSGVTYYIPYICCASFILSKYLKRSFFETADIVALAYLSGRGVNIIGCTVAGCCQGAPAEWGIYSSVLNENVIPVQLYESMAIFVIWFMLNRKYWRKELLYSGRCTALILILFGGLNAFTDIFTYIQPKLVYMLSVEGIFAFLTMCAGLVILYLVDKKPQDTLPPDGLSAN